MAVKKQRLPEPEELFQDYVKRMARHRDGRECVIAYMSRLQMENRDRHHIELVVNRLGQLAQKREGQVFAFVNGDVGLIVHDAPPGDLEAALFDIRFNFSEDPLVQAEDAGEETFIEQFDIRWDYDALEKAARERLDKFNSALKAQAKSSAEASEQEAATASESAGDAKDRGKSGSSAPALKAVPVQKPASLLDLDKSQNARRAARNAPGVTGPVDRWLLDNRVLAGGAYLPLSSFLSRIPLYEMERGNKVPAAFSLTVDAPTLYEAYTFAVGMKMSPQLEHYLVKEVEAGVLPLLRSLTNPVHSPSLAFSLSLQLSAETILSPAFLLTARAWQQVEDFNVLFWFEPEVLRRDLGRISYVVEFLHDLRHSVGLRGLDPCDLPEVEETVMPFDYWCLTWPEEGLERAAASDLRGLDHALATYGAGRVFLQNIDTREKSRAARAYGFQFAECLTPASEKIFTR